MFEYDWSQHNNDRLRRAKAWLERSRQDGTPDIERFMFLWIAFDSAYGGEDSIRDRHQTDVFGEFLENIVTKDKAEMKLFRLVWDEFNGPVRDLLNNHYVYEAFWRNVRGKGKGWKRDFDHENKNLEKYMEEPSTENLKDVLFAVFDRLYTLRNQIFHGGVTHPVGYGEPQIRDGADIMAKLVPAIVNIMKKDIQQNSNSKDWGKVSYPRIDRDSKIGRDKFSGSPRTDGVKTEKSDRERSKEIDPEDSSAKIIPSPLQSTVNRKKNHAPFEKMKDRFRGFLPVVVDVETGGFNAATDAILEVAAVTLTLDSDGLLRMDERRFHRIIPFEGSRVEQAALEFTGIDPSDSAREAISEKEAFRDVFKLVRNAVKTHNCTRAILVGHNAHFDHGFVYAAAERHKLKRNPFHPFSVFDTATLGGLAYGQTVLSRACEEAGISFEGSSAHSAEYDVEKTAELFCCIVNRWRDQRCD